MYPDLEPRGTGSAMDEGVLRAELDPLREDLTVIELSASQTGCAT